MSPPDDTDAPPPRPLMGPVFWLMLAFGAFCILAGVGFAVLAPRLLPTPPPAASAPEPAVQRPPPQGG